MIFGTLPACESVPRPSPLRGFPQTPFLPHYVRQRPGAGCTFKSPEGYFPESARSPWCTGPPSLQTSLLGSASLWLQEPSINFNHAGSMLSVICRTSSEVAGRVGYRAKNLAKLRGEASPPSAGTASAADLSPPPTLTAEQGAPLALQSDTVSHDGPQMFQKCPT